MTDAPAAFGVWSLMQTGKFTRGELGQGSLRFGYYVAFWSGPYFASVTGAQPDAAVQSEVNRLAAQLAAVLPRDSVPPDWFVTALPPNPDEVKYFRGKIGLSNIPLGEVSDLFDPGEGLVATYPGCRLLRLNCSNADDAVAQLAAAAIRATARKSLTGVKDDDGGFTCSDSDGNRIAVRTRGPVLLAFVFTDEAAFRALAAQLDGRSE